LIKKARITALKFLKINPMIKNAIPTRTPAMAPSFVPLFQRIATPNRLKMRMDMKSLLNPGMANI
jgi:hypothetical protein